MAGLARGGHAPVATFAIAGIAILIGGIYLDPLNGLMPFLGVLCLMIAVFFANFWRDPDRPIPKEAGLLVSPADGHVMFVRRERATGRRPSKSERELGGIEHDEFTGDWYPESCENPTSFETEQRFVPVDGKELETDVWRIAIFMSPLDVHVNRAPRASKIIMMEHRTGKGRRRGPFAPAYRKESEYNERVRTVFESNDGERIEVTQISGALARTIVPWKGIGDELRRGERYGMIRLGSRVDVRVPAAFYQPRVISAEAKHPQHPKGQFIRAGADIIFKRILEEE
ncbi:MAG: phosphatidylserine decarboxylase [Candidatus Thermoplasmatota archaeon]|nr:phosphatidylserine decarboxylase [Candidatus Thermoplasmatota archaeon]